jgi:hypothetical protein
LAIDISFSLLSYSPSLPSVSSLAKQSRSSFPALSQRNLQALSLSPSFDDARHGTAFDPLAPVCVCFGPCDVKFGCILPILFQLGSHRAYATLKAKGGAERNILKVSVISLFVKTYMCIENCFWCDYACDSCRCIYLSVCLGCSVSWTEEGARRKCRKSYLWEFIRELCVKSVAPESLRELAEAVTVNNNSCE